jgi:hypothetical protein
MNPSQSGARRPTQIEQFNELLKTSDYFADVMNTHRRATAEVLAELVGVMVKAGAINTAQVLQVLHQMENGRGKPSLGSARRLLASLTRDAMLAQAVLDRRGE